MSLGALQDAEGQLSHERLAVGSPFTCDDECRIFQHVVEVDSIEQKVDARAATGVQILQESIAKPACSPCSWRISAVETEMTGRDIGKPCGSGIERAHHCRRSSFLRGKDTGRPLLATERIGNVGSYGETDAAEAGSGRCAQVLPTNIIPRSVPGQAVDHGAKHADAAVAGGTTAKTYDDVAAASPDGISHELARAVGGGYQGITLFSREQREPAGPSHLYYSRIAHDKVVGRDAPHQRVAHREGYCLAPHCCPISLQPPLAAVADGYLSDLCPGPCRQNAFRRSTVRLTRRQATFHRIDSYHRFHGLPLPTLLLYRPPAALSNLPICFSVA